MGASTLKQELTEKTYQIKLAKNIEAYDKPLVYACVRSSLRKNIESIRKLEEQIVGMTSWDAHYWDSAFRELWWKTGNVQTSKMPSVRSNYSFEIKLVGQTWS